MSRIQINDLDPEKHLQPMKETEMKNVSGGSVFIKIAGIKSEIVNKTIDLENFGGKNEPEISVEQSVPVLFGGNL